MLFNIIFFSFSTGILYYCSHGNDSVYIQHVYCVVFTVVTMLFGILYYILTISATRRRAVLKLYIIGIDIKLSANLSPSYSTCSPDVIVHFVNAFIIYNTEYTSYNIGVNIVHREL